MAQKRVYVTTPGGMGSTLFTRAQEFVPRGRPVLSEAIAVLQRHREYRAAEEIRGRMACTIGMVIDTEGGDDGSED